MNELMSPPLLLLLLLFLFLFYHSPGVLDTVRSAAFFLFFIRATRSPSVENILARSVGVTSSVRLLERKRKRERERTRKRQRERKSEERRGRHSGRDIEERQREKCG